MISRTQLVDLLTLNFRFSAQTARKIIPPYLGDCISLHNADAILQAASEWNNPHAYVLFEDILFEEVSYALDEASGVAWHHNVFTTRRKGKTNYDLELDHNP